MNALPRLLLGIALAVVGVANLTGGLLSLFGGLAEVGLQRAAETEAPAPADRDASERREVGLVELAVTRYGAAALLFLVAGMAQIAVAQLLRRVLAGGAVLSALGLAAAVAGVAAEAVGWALKSALSTLNVAGLAVSLLLGVACVRARVRAS